MHKIQVHVIGNFVTQIDNVNLRYYISQQTYNEAFVIVQEQTLGYK